MPLKLRTRIQMDLGMQQKNKSRNSMRFYRINSTSWCFPFPRFSAGPFPFFSMPVFEGLKGSYRVPIVCYRGLGGVRGFYFLVLSLFQVFCWSLHLLSPSPPTPCWWCSSVEAGAS